MYGVSTTIFNAKGEHVQSAILIYSLISCCEPIRFHYCHPAWVFYYFMQLGGLMVGPGAPCSIPGPGTLHELYLSWMSIT